MSYCINGKERVLGDGTFLPDKPKGPSDLKLRWDTSYKNARKSLRGPDPTWSYAGALPDGSGGTVDGSIPPLHGEGGVWLGPGYTNALPAGSEDFQTGWTARGTTVTDNGDGSYRVTLGKDSSKDVYTSISVAEDTYNLAVEARLVSGGASLSLKTSSGSGPVDVELNTNGFTVVETSCVTVNAGLLLRSSASNSGEITVDLRFPQVVNSPYLFPYVPPGTSVTSAAGSTGDNGISFDLSGTQEVADGVELFVDPDELYVDENNYSTYDSETGICTIVTDGTNVTLNISDALTIGESYEITCQVIENIGQEIVSLTTSFGTGITFSETSDPITAVAQHTTLQVKRGTGLGGRLTFKLSVQKIITAEEPLSKALRECYEGKADGVERYVSYGFNVGQGMTVTDIAGGVNIDVVNAGGACGFSFKDDEEYTTSFLVDVSFIASNIAGTPIITSSYNGTDIVDLPDGNYNIVDGYNRLKAYTRVQVSGEVILYFVGASTFSFDMTNISVQKLNPAISTTAALVKMGVGNSELEAGQYENVSDVSGNHSAISTLLYGGGGETSYPSISYDGSSYRKTPLVSWDRYEGHLMIVQQDGTQFRAGSKRYAEDGTEIDTDPVWSDWASFDGSFDPLDALRLALNGTVPLWLKHLVVWDKVATEAEIERWAT